MIERAEAERLDRDDPLASFSERFVHGDGARSYADGNSLGRLPLHAAVRIDGLVAEWGELLVTGWGRWIELPVRVGDLLANVVGARAGEVLACDSTTVNLYKLAHAALDLRPGAIVVGENEFPTDRYVLEGVAARRGVELLRLATDPVEGPQRDHVAAAGEGAGLVVLSLVGYRSGALADLPAITAAVHNAGALVLWDLSHAAGAVPVGLAEHGVDLAVGCTYKFLNGGPGAPAFIYVRRDLQETFDQPLSGWGGHREPFAMAPDYVPAPGVRSVVSGTPPILAMVPLMAGLQLLEEAGMAAVRTKSTALTRYAIELVDAWLAPLGVRLASPRDDDRLGGHVMIRRDGFRDVLPRLWEHGVIPDFREPDGIRLGLAPLSTSFAEVHAGLAVLRDLLADGS